MRTRIRGHPEGARARGCARERARKRRSSTRWRPVCERFDPATQLEQDRAYADAMARVAASYPDDLDVATLYAEALFLLLPRPGAFDVEEPTVARVLAVLEDALTRDLRHPGACHLYIHMTELTAEPGRAEACASTSGTPSRVRATSITCPRTSGRGWADGATRSSEPAGLAIRPEGGARERGSMTYPAHDLHMLTFAAAMDGQGAVALQAARGFARLTSDPMLLSLMLVRFGQFDEVASIGERPANDISAGVWDFARGYAALRRGEHRPQRTPRAPAAAGALLERRVQDPSGEDAARNRGRDPRGRAPASRRQRRRRRSPPSNRRSACRTPSSSTIRSRFRWPPVTGSARRWWISGGSRTRNACTVKIWGATRTTGGR